jgi:hypothetical protein
MRAQLILWQATPPTQTISLETAAAESGKETPSGSRPTRVESFRHALAFLMMRTSALFFLLVLNWNPVWYTAVEKEFDRGVIAHSPLDDNSSVPLKNMQSAIARRPKAGDAIPPAGRHPITHWIASPPRSSQ